MAKKLINRESTSQTQKSRKKKKPCIHMQLGRIINKEIELSKKIIKKFNCLCIFGNNACNIISNIYSDYQPQLQSL